MVKLNNFSKKIHKAKKRVGRGIGSGLGKTSGRGAKICKFWFLYRVI